ncbi:MAG: hypothetical protein LAT57_09255 [Balneolales bacterium]|nr:hypothetical protein [Balneolales bacterium]
MKSAFCIVKDYFRPMSGFALITICILMHPTTSQAQVDYSNSAVISLKSGLFNAKYEHFDNLFGLDKGIYYGGSILLPVRLPFYIYGRLNYFEINNDSGIDPEFRITEASYKQRTIGVGTHYRLTVNQRFRVAANTGLTVVRAERNLLREGASQPSEEQLWNSIHGYFVGLNAEMYDRNFPLAIFFEFQKSFRFRPYTGIDFNNGLSGNSFGIGVRYYLNPPQRKRLF